MTGDAEDAVDRAARLRREVARTIEQVRAHTAEIGHDEGDGDLPSADAADAADAADDGSVAEGAVPPEGGKKGGIGGEVGALLARTRAVIARTKSVIEHTRAAMEHDHHHAEAGAATPGDAKD